MTTKKTGSVGLQTNWLRWRFVKFIKLIKDVPTASITVLGVCHGQLQKLAFYFWKGRKYITLILCRTSCPVRSALLSSTGFDSAAARRDAAETRAWQRSAPTTAVLVNKANAPSSGTQGIAGQVQMDAAIIT